MESHSAASAFKEMQAEDGSMGPASPASPASGSPGDYMDTENKKDKEDKEGDSSQPVVGRRMSTRSHRSVDSVSESMLERNNTSRLYKPPTWMRRLLTNKIFIISNVFIILLNMIWTGIYANGLVSGRNSSAGRYDTYFIVESIFSGCFVAELIVRLAHFASCRIWHDPWLCFDLVVIVLPAVELWIMRPLGWEQGTHSVTAMNIFRIFRVGRGVALLARIDWFRPMYLAAVGFKHSLASLLVVALYLGTLLFTFSLILCNLLGPTSPEYLNYPSIVRGRFRSVGTSYLTLMESLLGGIEWGPDLVDLLLQEMVFPGIVFFSFMIFGSLLWLNTVAGIFMQQVDRSFEATNAHQFKDPEFKAATQELLKDFQQDLKDLDRDETQSLSWRQISVVVTHHLELLSDLGIRLPEVKKIFSELDMNNTGYVSIPMFISRLIDNLKYKTLETLFFENQQGRLLYLMKKLARRNKASSKKVMEQLKVMSESIAEVESEEPLQAAVQRRLWKQKQRVAIEREQLSDSIVDADLTMPGPTQTSSGAGLFAQEGIKTKGHLVLDCWKRSIEKERRNLRALVNPGKVQVHP